MKFLVLPGRILYSLIFLNTVNFHFTNKAIVYAESAGVPMANVFVPLSGVIAIIGGLSISTGFKAKFGAWLIVFFLIPVTFLMHAFWIETEQMMFQMQFTNFMKNFSMLGTAFLITYFGSGPLSIDSLIFKSSQPK